MGNVEFCFVFEVVEEICGVMRRKRVEVVMRMELRRCMERNRDIQGNIEMDRGRGVMKKKLVICNNFL